MKWFSAFFFIAASGLGWFYFCAEPLYNATWQHPADMLISLCALIAIPVGLSHACRFGISLLNAALWAAAAYFRSPLWSTPEALLASFVWLFCLLAALFSTFRPLTPLPSLPRSSLHRHPYFHGKIQLIFFQFAWFCGLGFAFSAMTPTHALFFIAAWTLVMMFLCQMWFWPIPASLGWLGHDERKNLYLHPKALWRRERMAWLLLFALIFAIILYTQYGQ